MKSLTDLYENQILPRDAELEKQAAAITKVAEEEDAAGRIMARGFADELNKIAMMGGMGSVGGMGGMAYGAGAGAKKKKKKKKKSA